MSFTYDSTITNPTVQVNSPDQVPLVNLTVYDIDAVTLYANSVSASIVNTYFPGWNPIDNNVEVALLQVFAQIAAELVYGIDRLPPAILDSLLYWVGVTKSLGVAPRGTALFNLSDLLGHTVPAGTTLLLTLGEGKSVAFTTDVDLVVAPGSNSGLVAITATGPTSLANNTYGGSQMSLIQGTGAFVDSVFVAGAPNVPGISGGLDPESNTAFEQRGIQTLQRLSNTLVTADQMKSAALSNPAVFRCLALDNWNPAANAGHGASATGYVTLVVYGQGGASCTPSQMVGLRQSIASQAQVNLNLSVVPPSVTQVNVSATVVLQQGVVTASAVSAVTLALQNWLNTDRWPWEGTVYLNTAIQVIENAYGVDHVVLGTCRLNGAAADILLGGYANLAQVGTVAIGTVAGTPSTQPGPGTVSTLNIVCSFARNLTVNPSSATAGELAVSTAISSYMDNTALGNGTVVFNDLLTVITQAVYPATTTYVVSGGVTLTINGAAGNVSFSVSPVPTVAVGATSTNG